MRININTGVGVLEKKLIGKGSTLTDFLNLVRGPINEFDASSKEYVDRLFNNLSVASITEGDISPSQMPTLSGDVFTDGTTLESSLKPIINAGTYFFPTVNSKGLIISGGNISPVDLPNLDWSIVESGHPTDVIGYGIKDAITVTGGDINVNITLSGPPTQENHAVTKTYADNKSATATAGGVDAGDIMLKAVGTTPTGYLMCNGAMVSKTTYPLLYASLLEAYDGRIITGAGKPWQQQYNINNNNALTFNYGSSGGNLATTSAFGEVAVTKNKVYVIGGSNGVNINVIQVADIAEDGSIGPWGNYALTLPSTMRNFQVAVTRDHLYLLAGTGSGNSTNFIFRSPIDSNGNLGAWQTDGVLPHGVSGHQVFVSSSRMYVIGGSVDGGLTTISNVYYTEIAADGSLGTWSAGPSLPVGVQYSRLAVTKGRVYLLGGHTGSVVMSNMIYGSVDSQGVITAWTATGVLPVSVALGHTVVTSQYAYYLGGTINNDLSGTTGSILKAPINPDGSIGNWDLMTGNCPVKAGVAVSVRNRISVFGGMNASGSYLNSTTHFITPNTGAPNDYSSYYTTATFTPTASDLFRIPDLASYNNADWQYYIKY